MSTLSDEPYEFGPFRLEPAERRLLREGQHVPLPPKAFDLLRVLVSRAGRLVTKGDLLKEVWPNTFVEEANLSYTVSLLRKALEEDSDQRYIDTVQKRGYRFRTANPSLLAGGSATDLPAGPSRRMPARRWLFGAVAVAGFALAMLAILESATTRARE